MICKRLYFFKYVRKNCSISETKKLDNSWNRWEKFAKVKDDQYDHHNSTIINFYTTLLYNNMEQLTTFPNDKPFK